MYVTIVIPWRDSGQQHRRVNFDHIRNYYEASGLPVVVADDGRQPGQPFNRSRAYNRGLEAAGDPDVIIWNEADCLVPVAQLEAGITLAAQAPGLVLPYTDRVELTEAGTVKFRAGQVPPGPEDVEVVYGGGSSIGQCGITSRRTMRLVGQWDEHFDGWGFDDNAMFHAFGALAGPPRWVRGPGLHLWHPLARKGMTPEAAACTERNRLRYMAMLATTDAIELKQMICAEEDTWKASL